MPKPAAAISPTDAGRSPEHSYIIKARQVEFLSFKKREDTPEEDELQEEA